MVYVHVNHSFLYNFLEIFEVSFLDPFLTMIKKTDLLWKYCKS